ncbi:bifunctional folylpolyglutamate synthase/dihydrofolate synthase [Chloroflexota bacterium]
MEEITNTDNEIIPDGPPVQKHPLDDYYDRLKWLRSLITDPAGTYYFTEKTQLEYLKDYLKQINRTKAFLELAGNPQEQYPVVHIAGTSGKGSVTTMIGAILRQAGLRVGVHTSPYLQVCNEKLVTDDIMISPQEFVELIDEFRQIHRTFYQKAGEPLRYQEAWACLMYMYFAKKQVDWAVVETALGGRYDPSNVVPSKLAIITNIALEHTPQLGTSLAEIARHKAGIIKKGMPVITSEKSARIVDIFAKEAIKNHSKLYKLDRDFSFKIDKSDHTGLTIEVRTPFKTFNTFHINHTGTFNAINASAAVKAGEVLAKKYGVPITEEHIRAALEGWGLPGRMETVQQAPQVILDSAHNPQKMHALVDTIKAVFPQKSITVVIGMLAFKDVDAILKALLPIASHVIATQANVLGKPSLPTSDLKKAIFRQNPSLEVIECSSVKSGIEAALSKAKPDELVLITGSMYLIGEAREHWFNSEQMLIDLEGDR